MEAPKEEKKGQVMRKPDEALLGPNTALTIDFGKHSSILTEVEKLADEEMRPVDLQVIYMLKQALTG